MSGESHEFQVHLRVGETGVGVLEWSGRAPQEAVDQAVSLAADDGLIARGLRRIEVSLPASDTTGRRALHRAGFRLEGTRRLAHVAADGTFTAVTEVYGATPPTRDASRTRCATRRRAPPTRR